MTPEESLERTYRQLLHDALLHVAPGTGDLAKRQVFARLAHFLARSVRPDEVLVADLLSAASAATDHPVVLRCLACAVWAIVEDDPRLLRWFTTLSNRALERGHVPGFCTAVQLLVHLAGFDGQIPEAWLAGVRAAREDETARAEAFWLGWYWQERFHPDGGAPPPAWLAELRDDERELAAAAIVDGERASLCCALCGKAFTP